MRRKEGRGGRSDEESENVKKLIKKMKNEKVAKGRIMGLVFNGLSGSGSVQM